MNDQYKQALALLGQCAELAQAELNARPAGSQAAFGDGTFIKMFLEIILPILLKILMDNLPTATE